MSCSMTSLRGDKLNEFSRKMRKEFLILEKQLSWI